jgi:type IV pilus assembly protein PilE
MQSRKTTSRGFSLVELMVVVLIIGALAAIAMPQYDSYVARGRLAEGMSVLSELQLRQEQYYQDNRAYVNAMAPRVAGQYWGGTCTTSATTTPNQLFTCTATPTATSGIGYVFTVDQSGAKTTAATSTPIAGWTVPSPATCWVKAKAGTC